MANDLPEWIYLLEDVYFKYENPGMFPSPEQEEEYLRMVKQVKETKGFDIDFTKFTYRFNYSPLDFDNNEIAVEPETTRELIDRLSRKSLDYYNEGEGTKNEYVKVIKANYHGAGAGYMFYITFEGKDPCDDEPKPKQFRAKVCYLYFDPPMFIFCVLKPKKKVHSIETEDKDDIKKPRYMK